MKTAIAGLTESEPMEASPQIAAIRTIAATGLTLWLAQLFGKRVVHSDNGVTLTMARWRGKFYIIKIR